MDQSNLDKMEFLLSQSMRGLHLLFDNEMIIQILKKHKDYKDFFSFENMDKIQLLFTELIKRNSFQEKKTYIESLDHSSYELLVRAYFHILDNTLLSNTPTKH